MKANGDNDQEIITDTTTNCIAARLAHHFEDLKHKPGTVDNIKSGIKYHHKRNLRLEDGWTFDTTNNCCVGNP